MSKKHKLFASTATAALVASAIVPVASAADLNDFDSVPAYAQEAVQHLADNNILQGDENGNFNPSQTLTRAQAAEVLSKAKGLEATGIEDFSDVKEGQWFYDAVVATSPEFFEGDGTGKFNPNAQLTRAQAAKVIVLAYGLTGEADLSNYSDLKDVPAWAEEFFATAVENKIINGKTATTLAPNAKISRAEFATMVKRAMDTEVEVTVESVSAVNDITVNEGEKASLPETVEVTLSNEEKAQNEVEWDVTKLDTTKPGVYTVKGDVADTDLEASVKVTVVAVAPEVTGVSAVNSKQLVVTFNKAIKESTVISNTTTGALVANSVAVSRTVADSNNPNKSVTSVTGSLSEDGKTLTLTAAASTYFDGTYAIVLADSIKATDAQKLDAYAGTVTASDKVAPTVSKVEFNPSTGNFEVTLSEPVASTPDVLRVNGTPVSGLAPVANSNNTKFTVAKPASIAAGTTASIHLAGTADYAGNILTAFDGSVVVSDDQSAVQVVSTTQISSNQAKIVLNKPIASSDDTIDAAISALIDGQSVTAANVAFAKDTTDKSGKTIIATFNTGYTAPNYFYGTASSKDVTFVFANEQIVDVYGKKLGTATQTVTMSKDVTGPKAVSTKVSTDGSYIEITFDEVISNLVKGADNSNITLRKDGVAVAMNGSDADVVIAADENGDNKVLRISPDDTADLTAGTYTVRLAAGTVEDTHTNDAAIVNVNTTVSGTTTDLTAAFANLGGNNNQFQVTFSEAVDSSALERTNYTLDGTVLPEGTDIYFADSSKTLVNIVLPTDSVNFGTVGGSASTNNARLGVSKVTTSAGKVVVTNSATVKVEDNTAAELQSASLVGNNIIKLTFNENLSAFSSSDIADIIDDLVITDGTNTFAATAVASGSDAATATSSVSGKDLIITVTPGDSNWATVTGASSVTVKTVDTGDGDIQDANGVEVKADKSVTLTK
ncbi:S-layer homology domain-containing protein [Ureibacillus sp. GCM10028918]|uniref:S-layer homology domain-containing protein n=1 Tax=Ureibacillus sp. GCM10028918 TaxID=3273429 RepID=UPI00361BBCFC